MGLDMYLYGEKSVSSSTDANPVMEDGFIVTNKTLDIGYWRKHANLHGFIVKEFADGKDECQKIWLSQEDLQKIIDTLEADGMFEVWPSQEDLQKIIDTLEVEGFFFGRSYFPGESDEYFSYEKQKAQDIDTFTKALKWVRNAAPAVGKWGDPDFKWAEGRGVYYQASW